MPFPSSITARRHRASRIIPGDKFGLLTVVGPAPGNRYGNPYSFCRCECGTVRAVRESRLLSGAYSCGCSNVTARQLHKLNGIAPRPRNVERNIWRDMIRRCTDPRDSSYQRYGGRGIGVCDRWLQSFEAFVGDVGPRPSKAHSIERVDNNGNYEPSNVKWGTCFEQNRNRRDNRIITINGTPRTFSDWCSAYGIRKATVESRLRHGWTEQQAFTVPPGRVGVNSRKLGLLSERRVN